MVAVLCCHDNELWAAASCCPRNTLQSQRICWCTQHRSWTGQSLRLWGHGLRISDAGSFISLQTGDFTRSAYIPPSLFLSIKKMRRVTLGHEGRKKHWVQLVTTLTSRTEKRFPWDDKVGWKINYLIELWEERILLFLFLYLGMICGHVKITVSKKLRSENRADFKPIGSAVQDSL